MNFLDAHQILQGYDDGRPIGFLFAMSGTSEQFDLFLRAAAAVRGFCLTPEYLPFNTLPQALLSPPASDATELFFILPWDLVPEADWRTGFPEAASPLDLLMTRAEETFRKISARPNARILYLPAPLPPLFINPVANAELAHSLISVAAVSGARILPTDNFSLGSYLASGCPVPGSQLGIVAGAAIDPALELTSSTSKVLVTDMDGVMWSGVIAEDGIENIQCRPEGKGYKHFIYQGILSGLVRNGVLLAAVSRNDQEVALAPLLQGAMPLEENDFVAVIASYNAKSAQISMLSERLSLGLDAFVFVDDNPVELAEVSENNPQITCLRFPDKDDDMPNFCNRLAQLFGRKEITNEDRKRTEFYRRQLKSITPSTSEPADIADFLQSLKMKLEVTNRSVGDRVRAIQLINKTNQFNLNGLRVTDAEAGNILDSGGKLYTAALSDRSGSHGEILSILIGSDGEVMSFVLSCRVFERKVEHAFLVWLCRKHGKVLKFRYRETERNTPFQNFVDDGAFKSDSDGKLTLDPGFFTNKFGALEKLFEMIEPDNE